MPAEPADRGLEATSELLARCRAGDDAARDRLFARYLPLLRRWAHGRLPPSARSLADTDDLVQVSLVRALSHLQTFEPRHEGALLVYLRRSFLNAVRDEIRRTRSGVRSGLTEVELPDSRPSVVEQAMGKEVLVAYEAGLTLLTEEQREAVILRLEFGYTFQQIAEATGRPSADAARMAVSRGILRLAEAMDAHRP
jgi:RNA polymerase sigma-70 factor (ECF subfamily)